ncbi:MAG: hypothetical protein LQ340_005615 [Diploschistes diacapsis]|nr:MAG: hypothetical protein LQ340_005615 [Diploschistes diacapsis]
MPAPQPLLPPPLAWPILDFLAPSWARPSQRLLVLQRRSYASSAPATRRRTLHAGTSSSSSGDDETHGNSRAARPARTAAPLTKAQQAYLSRALRVNQAGELAATLIYAQQTPPLVRAHPHLRPLMQHMHAQEAGHLETFNGLLAKHRVRPTALAPLWTVAAGALGWGTALMGREAAMACTEAVETEIGEHYNNQVRELLAWKRERVESGEDAGLGEELEELLGDIRRIRDEELEHLDHAVGEDAREANGYPVLTAVIRGGCRGAIWLSERV